MKNRASVATPVRVPIEYPAHRRIIKNAANDTARIEWGGTPSGRARALGLFRRDNAQAGDIER
jgi:hypothetical protein